MDKYIGKLLDGRYEIVEVIGTGGMAIVYKARCRVLNRFVAIKILKDEFARDEEFRHRFYNESQAVAKLSHNNIVAVYDVSHTEDVDYIVMELIEGITLKEYLGRKGRLSWQETLFFSEQIARGLEHAHSRGIIHQDIKPHNIIILQDGTAKVTDFGIASFATNQETRVVQEAIGSVHYISPEQAKGSTIDFRTDLYSLGVVMYEMLTGKLPFEGETAVSIIMQHINAMPLVPSEVVSGVPLGMNEIVMHAMCPHVNRRYAAALEIYRDLELLRNDPTTRFSYGVCTESRADARAMEETQALPNIRGAYNTTTGMAKKSAGDGFDTAPIRQRATAISAPRPQKKKSLMDKISESPAMAVGIAVVCFVVVAAIVMGTLLATGSAGKDRVSVPNFVGLQLEDVLANASTQYGDFVLTESSDRVIDASVPEGQIVAQSVQKDKKVTKGTKIMLTAATGGENAQNLDEYTMPDFSKLSEASVVVTLDRYGVQHTTLEEASEEVEAGKIIRTMPGVGKKVGKNDVVTLYVSSGAEKTMCIVPDLRDKSLETATALLEERKLTLGTTNPVISDQKAGTVLGQSVAANTEVEEGTKVNLDVSAGITGSDPVSGEPTQPVPQQGKATVTVPLPQQNVQARVVILLDNKTAFDEMVDTASGTVNISLEGTGTQEAVVYVDDVMVKQQTVTFN